MDKRHLFELHSLLCSIFTSPKRLEIIDLLRDRERSVGELSRAANIRQSNLSQHLALLRSQGIVKTRREGVTIFYSLVNPKIVQAFDLVTEVLLERLASSGKLSEDLKKAQAN